MPDTVGRRAFLKAAGAAGIAAAVALPAAAEEGPAKGAGPEQPQPQPPGGGQPDGAQQNPPAPPSAPPPVPPHDHPYRAPVDHQGQRAYVFFTEPEAAFVAAAVDRFIPADETGPGALELGVVSFIDRQLAGAFGQGARMYLAGPWPEQSLPGQGYQLPLIPADLYRIAISEVDKLSRRTNDGKSFAELAPQQQEAMLQGLDRGEIQLDTVPGKIFFDVLLSNTFEGAFADPAYGGNLGLAAWKMIGFTGARGHFADEMVQFRNKPFDAPPVSLADLQ